MGSFVFKVECLPELLLFKQNQIQLSNRVFVLLDMGGDAHTHTFAYQFQKWNFCIKLFHGILSYVTVCMFFLMLHLFFNFFIFYDSHMKAKHIYSSQFCIHCVYIYTFSVLWSLLLRLPSNSGNSLTASYLMGVPCMMNASCTLIKWSLTFEKSFSFPP